MVLDIDIERAREVPREEGAAVVEKKPLRSGEKHLVQENDVFGVFKR